MTLPLKVIDPRYISDRFTTYHFLVSKGISSTILKNNWKAAWSLLQAIIGKLLYTSLTDSNDVL